jgi:hypothetical protein
MKKVLLALFLGSSVFMSAQNDVAITLTAPAANSTIGPGMQFNFDVTITNNGTQAITTSDTVVYFPSVNGGLLTQNGTPIGWYFTNTAIAGNGGTVTRSRTFGGLNISGAPAGNITFCGNVYVNGPNWSNVTESDTTNNTDCATVMYDPNAVGLAENVLHVDYTAKVIDNSYFANGIYNVDLANVATSNNEMVVIDITGKQVFTTSLNVNNTVVEESVNLSSLRPGIYIVAIQGGSANIATKKIIVQ